MLKNGRHFVINHLKCRQKCLDFVWSGFQMVVTRALNIGKSPKFWKPDHLKYDLQKVWISNGQISEPHCMVIVHPTWINILLNSAIIPLQAKQAREITNLTERKNPNTPVYGVKEFVCLSVCLSVINFDPDYQLKKKFAGLAAIAVFVSAFFFKNS